MVCSALLKSQLTRSLSNGSIDEDKLGAIIVESYLNPEIPENAKSSKVRKILVREKTSLMETILHDVA